jgi:tetratricopeptide (TPR) repeat protein
LDPYIRGLYGYFQMIQSPSSHVIDFYVAQILDPTLNIMKKWIGSILWNQGYYEVAERFFLEFSQEAENLFYIFSLYENKREYSNALKYLRKFLEKSKDQIPSLENLQKCVKLAKKIGEKNPPEIDWIRTHYPNSPFSIKYSSLEFLQKKDYKKAREMLSQITPTPQSVFRLLAVCERMLGDYENSLKNIEKALSLKPSSPFSIQEKAKILVSMGKWQSHQKFNQSRSYWVDCIWYWEIQRKRLKM